MDTPPRPLDSLTEEARYRLLVEAVTDYALYMLDIDGHVASWNPGAERLKQYSGREILGRHFSTFYTEEDRASGLPQRALAISASEGRFESEGWRVRKDGSRFWALVVIDPIRAPDGALLGYAKITRDLSERRRTEEALRRSEEQFRLLVQGVTDSALYMLDPQGFVSSWNAGAQRIKGWQPDEIIGQHVSTFYSEEDRARGEPQKSLETARREGRFEKEGWRLRKDGSRFWANVVIDCVRDDHGAIVGFAKVTRDVTERMEAQRALEQARETLFQSQKLDALGRLTGGIAHDFNNLLTAVLGSLELAVRRLKPDPKVAALLDNAAQAARRGTALTQRLLAFARSQAIELESIDVADLVRGMTDLLQRSLGPSVWIDTDFPDGLPPVRADANQLELALLNLAMNARDALPEGGPIAIAARTEVVGQSGVSGLSPGSYVRLSVTDKGLGMQPEVLARAMEPFFTTKGVGKGTGLGLSMVHGMAEQWGGRLVLRSQPGEGTTAELWLPGASGEETGAGSRSPHIRSAGLPQSPPLTVLAVDDDALVLMNTCSMLEELGHKVRGATTASQALEILQREPAIDLVLTDQAMPLMTGTQLAAAIRARRPALPVVLVTGYAELPPGVEPGLPRLSKPYALDELARMIATTVPRTGGTGTA